VATAIADHRASPVLMLSGLGLVLAVSGTSWPAFSIGLAWILIMSSQVLAKGHTAPVASRLFRLGLFG
jgi:hypothetical protein